MKRMLLIMVLVLVPLAYAIKIVVMVPEKIDGVAEYITVNESRGLLTTSVWFYNIGSVGYKTRMRLDVHEGDKLVFSGWSRELDLHPAARKEFVIYWYSNETGNFTASLRMYYAQEIMNFYNTSFAVSNESREDAFQITGFKTYDGYVRFSVTGNDTADAVVIPSGYPASWIFEQGKLGGKRPMLPYSGPFIPLTLTITVVSLDGRYASSRTFVMEKQEGLQQYLSLVVDRLEDFLNV